MDGDANSKANGSPSLLDRFDRPVVFKNRLQEWSCRKWTLDEWASRTADVVLNFRVGPLTASEGRPLFEVDGDRVETSMKGFLDWTLGRSADVNGLGSFDPCTHFAYSAYNHMSATFQKCPEVLQSVDWSGYGFPNRGGKDSTFWLGSAGASTPCHQDTYGCNLVAQLIGKKSWTLFPPEDSARLYPTRIPYEESSVFSQVDLLDVDLGRYPDVESCCPYLVTLEPGDVLFVPKGWWHFVRCLDTALSVNTWLPAETDDESRLEEAVARTLATALVPCYEPDGERWLNPGEEFVEPETNLAYVRKTLEKAKSKVVTGASKDERNCDDSLKAVGDAVLVERYTLEEYARRTGSTLRPGKLGETSKPDARDLVGCFLHPDVVGLVAKKLRRL